MSRETRLENRFEALRKKYEADIAVARAELENYAEASVGVAEHPDIMETVEKELAIIAEYDDKLEALRKYFPED